MYACAASAPLLTPALQVMELEPEPKPNRFELTVPDNPDAADWEVAKEQASLAEVMASNLQDGRTQREAREGKLIGIVLETPDGESTYEECGRVWTDDTVENFRASIARAEQMRSKNSADELDITARLLCAGRQLEDGKLLKDYELVDGTVIQVLIVPAEHGQSNEDWQGHLESANSHGMSFSPRPVADLHKFGLKVDAKRCIYMVDLKKLDPLRRISSITNRGKLSPSAPVTLTGIP